MTTPDGPAYVHFLEAIVAALAIKAGLNPNTMMHNALTEIAQSGGMDSEETQRLIDERWGGRDLSTAQTAARLVEIPDHGTPEEEAPEATETASGVDMRARLQGYRKRRSEGRSDGETETG